MWIPTADAHGRVYYYHTTSRDVRWDNPWRDMLRDAQRFAERVLEVSRLRHLEASAHMGLALRLRRMFDRWTEVTASTRVRDVRALFDAWMRLRQTLLHSLGQRETLLEELVVHKLRCAELERELVRRKVNEADREFDRLRQRAKSGTE